MMYRYLLSTLIFSFFSACLFATGFEGNITLVKQTYYDTSYYTYSIKDKLVRIDEKNSRQQVMQSLIIDIKQKSILALSPSQKLYTSIQKLTSNSDIQKDFAVTKTDNFKYIDGYKCYLWRVRNTNLNVEISFWVVEADFSFFNEVISLLSQTEDYSRYCLYFDRIPDVGNYFPMQTVEKTLLRDEKMKVTVQDINRKKIDDRLFQVPEEYKYLRL